MEIIDNSNDKKYFTQTPNFILNHSSANDQALYLQMKRITGEKDKCKAGEKYFCKQLKIGRKALKNSLEYLIKHNWITRIGKEPVKTTGGEQLINCYVVNDIWKMNMDYYDKGVSERELLDDKGVSESNQRGAQKDSQGVLKRDNKEEPIKKNIKEEHICVSFDKFWSIYPRKVAKKKAMQLWEKLNPNPLLVEKIIKAISAAAETDQWRRGFIPHPTTYISQERWNDEILINNKKNYGENKSSKYAGSVRKAI